ncbi:class A beta-lactamase [Roseomonas sp. SSH11]|uniref:beta-lactamase n=1 Tax=Pararoseomonas baculiformis TaxID=2820812 RepID=A0ABS4AIP8_9PROT|nr:class A beta-lactamase [Pararoseomonas baculiformis]MBP0446109.1 class A beta-lactamase [Pararoseomonas baculiformis]
MIGRRFLIGGTACALGGMALAPAAQAEDGFARLPAAFARIEAARGGRLGVAVLDTGSGRRAAHRGEERVPMCSTFKLLLAAAILARADAGKERLDRRIRYTRQQLITYSPVTEPHAGGEGMTLEALCEGTMILSDNTAANLLLDVLGGPAALTAWLRGLGDTVTRLDRIEPALNEFRQGDPRDTTTPQAMLATMGKLTLGDALSPASRAKLVGWLRGNRTGDARLKARLPAGWAAGEKTGTAGRTSNDIGLFWPPGGAAPILVTAYLVEGAAEGATRDAALADVGAAIAAAYA